MASEIFGDSFMKCEEEYATEYCERKQEVRTLGAFRFGYVLFDRSDGSVQFDSVRFRSFRLRSVPSGSVRFSTVRFGSVRFDSVRSSTVRFGSVRFDSIGFGSVRLGSVWYDTCYDRGGYLALFVQTYF